MRSVPKPNVFTSQFLDRLAHRERSSPTSPEAAFGGPWSVVERDQGFAVLQEPDADPGLANAEFVDRETALLIASVYPTVGRAQQYRLRRRDGIEAGFDVQTIIGGQLRTVGWVRHNHPELLDALHVVECLLRSPHSMASLLEAASYEVLSRAGMILQRLTEEERS